MAKKNRLLRKAITSILEPALVEAGFQPDYPEYRRLRGDTAHLASFFY